MDKVKELEKKATFVRIGGKGSMRRRKRNPKMRQLSDAKVEELLRNYSTYLSQLNFTNQQSSILWKYGWTERMVQLISFNRHKVGSYKISLIKKCILLRIPLL